MDFSRLAGGIESAYLGDSGYIMTKAITTSEEQIAIPQVVRERLS